MILSNKINGKQVGFVLSESTLRMFARKKGKSNVGLQQIEKLLGDISLDDMDLLFWCGLKVGSAITEDCEFDLSLEELQEWFDDHPEVFDELNQMANEDSPIPDEDEVDEDDPEKKPQEE